MSQVALYPAYLGVMNTSFASTFIAPTGDHYYARIPNALINALRLTLPADRIVVIEAGHIVRGGRQLVWTIASHPQESEGPFTVVGVPGLRVDGDRISVVIGGPEGAFQPDQLLGVVSQATDVPKAMITTIARGARAVWSGGRELQIVGKPGQGALPLGMASHFKAAFGDTRVLDPLKVENKVRPWHQLLDRLRRMTASHPPL
jgi:hypothetical protein